MKKSRIFFIFGAKTPENSYNAKEKPAFPAVLTIPAITRFAFDTALCDPNPRRKQTRHLNFGKGT
jgi:hypothetical protein